ncbi:exotoxin A binding domain-containing protein [Yersinia sp. 2541 StPb PI]|uniref:exotoxin A binding domain-containing protein n=1 Tax=Yersinia sp. 2541 StPb PI TaxID=3117407 RepID=UPI003FA4458A
MCLSHKQGIDFIDQDDEVIRNDSISSISIPNGMFATIYKNDSYNMPYFNLAESIGQRDLAALDMDNQISSVIVANSPLKVCSERCIILKRMQFPLSKIFASYWNNINHPNKQVLLSFDINNTSDFMVGLPQAPVIWLSNRELSIFGQVGDEPLVFHLHPDANRLSLTFHLNSNRIAIDYMESRGTEQIALSPTIELGTFPFNNSQFDARLTINNNASQPLIIDQIVMVASTEDIQPVHHRSERDTAGTLGCAFIPALAIYNYVTHSRCNQGDTLWGKVKHWFSDDNKDKSVVITTKPPLLEPQPQRPENSDSAGLMLTKLDTQLHNQALTLPAAAQFCKTSIDNILAERYPRDVNLNCQLWVARVLADFTLLFGDSLRDWTLDVLRRVLMQIHTNDTTGYAASDPAAESRLVNEVQLVVRQFGIDETIRQLSQAFDYTRLNYARYLLHNPTATAPPSGAQRLPLGTYSLSLASYHYPTDPPTVRVLENDQWVTHPDLYFDVDIFDTTIPIRPDIDAAFMDDALAAVGAWSDIYNEAPIYYHITSEPWSEHNRTIEAGRINNFVLYSELISFENNYVYVAVRLQGDIVNILAARRDETFENSHENYYIEFFVTDPNYVLLPDDEGSVRGAGSAALHGLARYLQQHGVKVLRFRTPSQPAARVATKLSFQHDEF